MIWSLQLEFLNNEVSGISGAKYLRRDHLHSQGTAASKVDTYLGGTRQGANSADPVEHKLAHLPSILRDQINH